MSKKVLIVNKDVEAATKLKEVIECSCTKITLVTSMEEALYRYFKTQFCLIIFDANMSGEKIQ